MYNNCVLLGGVYMNLGLLTDATTTPGSTSSTFLLVAYIVVIGAALYFFMIRPQKKRKKDEEKLRNNIEIGDEIVTVGGIQARVVTLKEDSIIIESSVDHSKIKIAKWAVQSNSTIHDDK